MRFSLYAFSETILRCISRGLPEICNTQIEPSSSTTSSMIISRVGIIHHSSVTTGIHLSPWPSYLFSTSLQHPLLMVIERGTRTVSYIHDFVRKGRTPAWVRGCEWTWTGLRHICVTSPSLMTLRFKNSLEYVSYQALNLSLSQDFWVCGVTWADFRAS